jgi:hypothetical protein
MGVLDTAGVATCDAHHGGTERHLTDLHQQMHVIGHPAVGVDPHPETLDDFRNQRFEAVTVLGLKEDVFAVIATQDHMIEATFDMNAWRSRHGRTGKMDVPT